MIRHSYGWRKDKPDSRDVQYAERLPLEAPPTIPSKINLTPYCPPIEDQGRLGSCTAQALVGALEFLERKTGKPPVDLSRLFVYYQERVLEDSIEVDAGAQIRDGVRALARWGVCHESSWPYDVTRFSMCPPQQCYEEAARHQILAYYRVGSLQEMKISLAAGYPVVFGFLVFDSMETKEVQRTGRVPSPSDRDVVMGGHAVMAVGYDDRTGRIIFRNSWGTRWGKRGYGTVPYAFISNPFLATDFWTIRLMESGNGS